MIGSRGTHCFRIKKTNRLNLKAEGESRDREEKKK